MPFTELLAKVGYLTEADRAILDRAFRVAERAHDGQRRLTGEPYVEHPLAVACVLADLRLDPDTLAAALLHDTLEDTEVTRDELRAEFGEPVAKLVDGVTKLGRIHVHSRERAQAENIRKMLVAMAEDIRVVLIKLGDRLHNMRTIEGHDHERRQRISRETLDIYAPLAHRLGIWEIKGELEDRAFAVLDPDNYRAVASRVATETKERERVISGVVTALRAEFEQVGVTAEISGRPKNVYSTHEKMRRSQKQFEEIYDLVAVRVLVDSIKECYGVLGIVHSLWKPIPGRFKDYVAMPKGNGYQSLHTTVITDGGERVEIQIRTHEMHATAEYGVAAHWRYKAGRSDRRDPLDERYGWLGLLVDWQKEVLDAEAFVDTVKVDIFQDEVFVFTPKGDVRSLPSGSTPVDFAYRVHTDVGHRCIGAKVNSRMVPLDHRLQNGDIVEILTTKGPHGPSRDWLNFVRSSSTKEKIRQYFKKEHREENAQRGRELLDRELRRMRQTPLASMRDDRLAELARDMQANTVEDFFAAIGYGGISARGAVLKYIAQEEGRSDGEPRSLSIPLTGGGGLPSGKVRVHGMTDMLTTLASCCKPVSGEAVRGYVTRGKGVTVHRAGCPNVQGVDDTARLIDVEWEREQGQLYPVGIKIEAWDRTGLLRDIAAVIAESRINVSGADVQVRDGKMAVISTIVEIQNLTQLSRLLERLEAIRDVQMVSRDAG